MARERAGSAPEKIDFEDMDAGFPESLALLPITSKAAGERVVD